MRPVYYNEIEPFAADWLVGNKGVRMTDDIYRDGPDSAIDAFCTRPAVDRQEALIAQADNALSEREVRLVREIQALACDALDDLSGPAVLGCIRAAEAILVDGLLQACRPKK